MLRVLLRLAVLAVLVGWLLSWVLRLVLRRGNRPPPSAGDLPEPMVRDRICNTFLPRARALAVEAGGTQHFFCSEACRQRFLEQASVRSGKA